MLIEVETAGELVINQGNLLLYGPYNLSERSLLGLRCTHVARWGAQGMGFISNIP